MTDEKKKFVLVNKTQSINFQNTQNDANIGVGSGYCGVGLGGSCCAGVWAAWGGCVGEGETRVCVGGGGGG